MLFRSDEAQVGIKIAGRNINNLRYADDTTLMAESEEELESLLMKVKVESEKVGLKLNVQKMKIMESGPITSWETDGETVLDFIFLGSKVTADGDQHLPTDFSTFFAVVRFEYALLTVSGFRCSCVVSRHCRRRLSSLVPSCMPCV